MSRIFRNSQITAERWKKAESAGNKYIRNIAQSKTFANSVNNGDLKGARSKQYSQNTYMGYNNG